jgi:hypothetical protein
MSIAAFLHWPALVADTCVHAARAPVVAVLVSASQDQPQVADSSQADLVPEENKFNLVTNSVHYVPSFFSFSFF